MRKGLLIAAILLVFLSGGACRAGSLADMPAWDYPIDALTLNDLGGYLVLANRDNLLDASFVPQDLTRVTAKRVNSDFELRRKVNDALNAMFAAAKEDGYTLYVKSAYRSFQTQNTMYHTRLERYGRDDGLVAYPGASDHQTGLGVDILNYAWTQRDGMNAAFGDTAEGRWMAEHCDEFGFVIRYMDGKEDITGIKYEPWHLRYVGEECAAYMMDNTLSLEEFTAEYTRYIAEFEAAGGDFAAYCRLLSAPPPVVYTGVVGADGDEEVSLFYDGASGHE